MTIEGARDCMEHRDKNRSHPVILWIVLCLIGLGGCTTTTVQPDDLRLTPQTTAKRQLQMRIFDSDDEVEVLVAIAAVLQDIGFLIDESEMQLGLIVGSKERSAIQPAAVAASVTLAVALTLLTGEAVDPVYDKRQTMRVSVVTTPVEGKNGTAVRVSFQRLVFTNTGVISKKQVLGSDKIYQEFFSKLSKSLFLGTHGQ
jgi:hypothetical protein